MKGIMAPLRIAPLVLFAVTFAWNAALRAQSAPASAKEGLRIGSPQSVLDDPIVRRCRLLAARRTDPKLDSITTAVEKAAAVFNLQLVHDAVATCRAALAAYPTEPKVIIAHYNASEALSVVALGTKFPDSDEMAFDLVLQETGTSMAESSPGLIRQVLAFFLGSAYEYGVGTKPNLSEAMKWYAVGAAAGDPISKRELMRLQGTKQ